MAFREAGGVLLCPPWDRFSWQKHGFGTRNANPLPALTLRQVHSGDVLLAGDFADRECEGDALVTTEINRPIGVRTADCVPVLLLDPGTRAVAAVHAGWRGTAASIVSNAIEEMQRAFASQPCELEAAIGPCIRVCCYEVSDDVAARFPEANIRRSAGSRPHLDLAAANRDQMIRSGLAPEHIFDCELCTFCRAELFYSYRREPADPGRMLSAICRLA
ncbi:MAG TPA: peptidoglycan editing factor PgeF [Bryobacteraceae bacterium]|nr:peptidoglycan editing factor PgeF [Bryobacteraceae bacterium]